MPLIEGLQAQIIAQDALVDEPDDAFKKSLKRFSIQEDPRQHSQKQKRTEFDERPRISAIEGGHVLR